jgi:hypothetical protein
MTTKKATKKAVAAGEDKELSTVPSFMAEIAQDSGAGLEGADKDSFAIPFLRILQALSPQCTEGDGARIPEAKPGFLFNTVTKEVWDGQAGLDFYPVAFERKFLRWAPRGSAQTYLGAIDPEVAAQMEFDGEIQRHEGRLYFPHDGQVNPKKCDLLTDTRFHYGLIGENGSSKVARVLLALASTQIKRSKQLMAILNESRIMAGGRLVTPPTWVNRIALKTRFEQNDEGSWHSVEFTPNGHITEEEIYQAGKSFHTAIAAGAVKKDYAPAEEAEQPDASEGF